MLVKVLERIFVAPVKLLNVSGPCIITVINLRSSNISFDWKKKKIMRKQCLMKNYKTTDHISSIYHLVAEFFENQYLIRMYCFRLPLRKKHWQFLFWSYFLHELCTHAHKDMHNTIAQRFDETWRVASCFTPLRARGYSQIVVLRKIDKWKHRRFEKVYG